MHWLWTCKLKIDDVSTVLLVFEPHHCPKPLHASNAFKAKAVESSFGNGSAMMLQHEADLLKQRGPGKTRRSPLSSSSEVYSFIFSVFYFFLQLQPPV